MNLFGKLKRTINENTSLSYILFAISMSGFLSLYFVNYLTFIILPFYKKALTGHDTKLEFVFNHLSMSSITVFSISLLISVIALILIPLAVKGINDYDKTIGLLACVLTFFLFFEFVISISAEKITGQFIFILWFLFFVIFLQLERISKSIYRWLLTDTDNKFDIAKLTFVWGIIVAILTLVNKK